MAGKVATKKAIAQLVAERFSGEAERRRVLVQALELRGQILATTRELRAAYAELGENMYLRLKQGKVEGFSEGFDLETLKVRIDGLLGELAGLEEKFKGVLEPGPLDRQGEN